MPLAPGMAMSGYHTGQAEEEEEKKRKEREATYDVEEYEKVVKDKPKYDILLEHPEGRAAYEESKKVYLSPEQFATAAKKRFPGRYDSYDNETLTRSLVSDNPAYAQFVDPEFLSRPAGARVYDEDYEATFMDAARNALHGFRTIPESAKSFLVGIPSGIAKAAEGVAETGAEAFKRTPMPWRSSYTDEQVEEWKRNVEIFKEGSRKAIDPETGEVMPGYKRLFSDVGTQYAEELRKQSNEQIQEWIDRDYDLQAYMAWQTDKEWSVDNFIADPLDMVHRGISEFLPSITSTVIGAGLGATAGFYTGGLPGALVGAGIGAQTMGTIMEGSSSYNEAMRYMVDEKGINPEDAIGMATTVSSAYGLVSGWLEKFKLKKAGKMVGLPEHLFSKTFTRKMLESIITKASKDPKKLLAKEGIQSAIRRTDWVMDGIIEGFQELSQATADQMTANIYKKYSQDGKLDMDGAARNFLSDFVEASTSKEAKDSFFSAMVGSLGLGLHTKGPIRALKWSKAGLQSSAGKKITGMIPGMPSMPTFGKTVTDAAIGRAGEEETMPVAPVIKDDASHFKILANEISEDPQVWGERSKLLADDADDVTRKFVKSTGDLGTAETALKLYQKGVKELKEGESPDKILAHLNETERTGIESLIADQFISKMSAKGELSGKLRALLGDRNTVIDLDSPLGVKTVMSLLNAQTREDQATILRNAIKLSGEELTTSEITKLVNAELASMPEGMVQLSAKQLKKIQEGKGLETGPKEGDLPEGKAPEGGLKAGDAAKRIIGEYIGPKAKPIEKIKDALFDIAALVEKQPEEVMQFLKNLSPEMLEEFAKNDVFSSLKLKRKKDGTLYRDNKKNLQALEEQIVKYAEANVKRQTATTLDLRETLEGQQTVENIEQAIAGLEEVKKRYSPLDKEYGEIIDEIDELETEKNAILQDEKRRSKRAPAKESFLDKAVDYDFIDKAVVLAAMEKEEDIPQSIINKFPDLAKKYGYTITTKEQSAADQIKKQPTAYVKPDDVDQDAWDNMSEGRQRVMSEGQVDVGEGDRVEGGESVASIKAMAAALGGDNDNADLDDTNDNKEIAIDPNKDPDIGIC